MARKSEQGEASSHAPSARAVVHIDRGGTVTFGEYLRSLRDQSGSKVTDLAERSGISRQNYYQLERDKQAPTIPTAVALLRAFGMASRIPAEEEQIDADLVIIDTLGEHRLVIRTGDTAEQRTRTRARAATRILPTVGGALVPAGAIVIPAIQIARHLKEEARKRRNEKFHSEEEARSSDDAAEAQADAETRAAFEEAAAGMPTEELEALIEVMRQMRPSSG